MEPSPRKNLWHRKAGLLGLVLVLALGILGWLIFAPQAIEVDTAQVTRGEFIQDIRAEGYFRSKDIRIIAAFAAGDVIERITVKVGDRVKKGQTLAVIYWDRRQMMRAPMDGIITKVFRDHTGPVNRGDPLVEMMDPMQMEVVAELLTTDAVKVKPGNKVILSGWGGPETLTASVTRISKAGFIKPSALGVEEERTEVVAGFEAFPANIAQEIGSHFHTELRIQVQHIPDVLKLPIGALVRRGSGWAAFQIASERAILTPITIGPRNNDEAVLETGLAEGTRVIIYPGEDIDDQVRVKAIRRNYEH
jgi:HlyD family secretion protein